MKRRFLDYARIGQVAIVLAAVVLIALTWLGCFAALRANRAAVEARAAAEIANETLIFADRTNEQLAAIDRMLQSLAHEWEAHPSSFDLSDWRQHAVLLASPAMQICLTDASGVILQATDPTLIGRSLSGRGFFHERAALPRDDGQAVIGQAVPKPTGSGWALNVARRLDAPDGSFAGVISVAYDIGQLFRYYGLAGVGHDGLVALIGMDDGRLRAALGAGAAPGESIADTALWRAMISAPDKTWVGPSAPDGLERLHAFRTLPNRDLDLVVAMSEADALRPATRWDHQALAFAGMTTVLVMILAGALLAETAAAHRRVGTLARDRARLAAAKADADAKSQRLEVTLAGMSDGVMMMDAELRLVEWNGRFPEMIGLPSSVLVRGMALVDVLRMQAVAGEFGAVDVEAEVARRIAAIRAADDSVTTERTRPDGRAIAVRRRRLADGSFVTIYTDVTERRRDEEALRKARILAEATAAAKSRLVAVVSHEIRQPLNALLNSLTLLSGADLSAVPHRLVETARQSGDALLGLLNDILDMAKLEAGQLPLRPSAFVLQPLLQCVLDMFAEQAARRGITLTLEIAPGTPQLLQGDAVRLRQILTNLLSNAVKFSAPGEVRLVAALEPEMPGMLRLTVRDPGPLIDPAASAQLFQPFTQLGAASGRADSGTGLGLAICRALAGLLGGEVGYKPSITGGNAFWVRLPFCAPAEPAADTAGSRPHHPRTRVLLVEDLPLNQLVVATMLRQEGHLVDVVATGREAIATACRQPYDLLLMDLQLADMTGIETARSIRALHGPAGTVPICAMTGSVASADRARCMAAGMDDVLTKPVAGGALLDMLGRLVWRPDAVPLAASPQKAATLLARSRLDELRAFLTPAMLTDLVDRSIGELTERLAKLQVALHANDIAAAKAEAHAAAGLADNYAMAALARRLHVITDASQDKDLTTAAIGLDALLTQSAAALRQAVAAEMAE